jgi:hypothetical protein
MAVKSYSYEVTNDVNNPVSPLYVGTQDYQPVGLDRVTQLFDGWSSQGNPKLVYFRDAERDNFDIELIREKDALMDSLHGIRNNYLYKQPTKYNLQYTSSKLKIPLLSIWRKKSINDNECYGIYLFSRYESIFVYNKELCDDTSNVREIIQDSEKELLLILAMAPGETPYYIQFTFQNSAFNMQHLSPLSSQKTIQSIYGEGINLNEVVKLTEKEGLEIIRHELGRAESLN